jgi:serine/threonine protein kinase
MQAIGNYDLMDKIAEGGMGTVYRGRNRLTGDIVAVKVVPPHMLTNPVVVKRFEQEYNVAKNIDHPNIVKALDFGQDDDKRFLVMEFVEGESLGQKLERDGKMSETEAIRIISQIAFGLAKAHLQGMIHRDVKPDNILITPLGVAKLTDLGLVKEVDAELNLTRTGRGLGTPHFMAPEQFRNAKKADARCDIYSLGATLYMMVTGQLPFESNGPLDAWMKKINNEIEDPRAVAPDLSERIDWAIRRAISVDPHHRPGTCLEFIEDLTGESTQRLATNTDLDGPDYWYLVFTDEDDVTHSVKGTIKGIRHSLQQGRLQNAQNVRVARTKAGPFEPLRAFPEFRDLVIQPEKVLTPKQAAAAAHAQPTELDVSLSAPTAPPGLSDSSVLTTTTLGMSAMQAAIAPLPPAPAGPRINLGASQPTWTPDYFKWAVLFAFFGGIATLGIYILPTLVRFIRFL